MLSTIVALCEGNHWSQVDSLCKMLVIQIFDYFFIVSMNKQLNKQSKFCSSQVLVMQNSDYFSLVSLNKLLNKQSSFHRSDMPWFLCDITIMSCQNYNCQWSVSDHLTHWGWDKIAAIFQMTFKNAFSWMEMHKFWLQFHWNLFLLVQLTIVHNWFR